MKFLKLYNRLGRQPMAETKYKDVTLKVSKDEALELLNKLEDGEVSLPLRLCFFSENIRDLHFEVDREKLKKIV